ncbi:MAG: hypothetical protein R3F65_12735 [bacterium]
MSGADDVADDIGHPCLAVIDAVVDGEGEVIAAAGAADDVVGDVGADERAVDVGPAVVERAAVRVG